MARFRFRLDRLLRVRTIEERLARSEWSQGERIAQAAEDAQDRARAHLHRSRSELAAGLEGSLHARAVLTQQALLGGLGRRLAGARETYLTARGQADRLGDHWRTRNAASEALSRLRERDRLAHRREEARREAAEMDEVALTRRPAPTRASQNGTEQAPLPSSRPISASQSAGMDPDPAPANPGGEPMEGLSGP